MKQEILDIAKVKSEKEFYKLYPTKEDFMKVHGKEFKKAKMGASMVKKQLTQLTDFANPPQAQVGKIVALQPTSADSARLYNAQINLNKFYDKEVKAGRMKPGEVSPISKYSNLFTDNLRNDNLQFYRSESNYRNSGKYTNGSGAYDDQYKEFFNLSPNQVAQLELQGIAQTKAGNEYQQYYRDLITPMQNLAAPFALIDSRITPQKEISYKKLNGDYPGGDVRVYDYDPLAIKPYVLRTPKEKEEWNKKYGGTKSTPQPKPKPTATGKPTPKPKTTPNKKQPVKQTENPPTQSVKTNPQPAPTPVVEKKQNSYEGSPIYYPGVGIGSGAASALVGFANQRGDTTYIQPEDYQRFAVPASGKEFIESKTKKNKNGGGIPKAQKGRDQEWIGGIPPQYQLNPYAGNVNNNATYNNQTGMFNSTTGQVSMADTQAAGFNNDGSKTLKRTVQDLNANEINSGIQMTSMIGKNVQKIGNAIENKKKAKQLNALAPVITQAAGTRPERIKNKYVRPEDVMFDPNQMFPSYGTGTNVLAANGASIGGNPTEIQNMYSSGDLYSDLGYEPLNDSDRVKQYRRGGHIPKAAMGIGDMMAIGNEVGNMLGDATAGIINIGTNRLNKQNEQMLGQAGFQSGMQNIQQNQYGAFMEDGGWVSHDWQPQTITKFGEYNLKDLLREDPMMDTLRSGGHLKNYAPPSEEAMSTERFDMGGELQTHWGGYTEPISYNPFLPDGGVTMMPRGQSHAESDGQGRTGIGITYGENPVEVERGEPMVKLKDGGEQESLVVYGNMKIPSYGLSELNDPLAKGKKFKNYANILSKKESKQNKIVEKGTKLIDDVDPNDSFDLLKLNSAQAMVMGGNMKLKKYADKKILLSGIQNAILDTAKELGVESDALSKGKIKQDKNSDMAKFGGKFTKAQNGTSKSKYDPEFESFIDQAMQLEQANSSQSGDYRGGGNYFGTNNAAYNTPEKAKEYYFKKYWSKVKDLPPGLRTRALQMAINTGDPYGELMVAAGTMSLARRRATKDERKDKSIVGNADWEEFGKKRVLKQYNEDPQAFLGKLDAEQNRYYNSLVEANTDASGKTFGSINPNTSREFYDDYLGLAKFAAEPFIKKPTLQQAIQQSTQPSIQNLENPVGEIKGFYEDPNKDRYNSPRYGDGPLMSKMNDVNTDIPTQSYGNEPGSADVIEFYKNYFSRSLENKKIPSSAITERGTVPSPVDESGNYYMPGYQPYGQEVPAAPMNKSNGRDFVQQKYQNPSNIDPLMNRWSSLLESVQNRTQPVTMPERYLGVNKPEMTAKLPAYVQNMESSVDRSEDVSNNDKDKKKFDYMKVLRELQPYLIPSNQEPLDPNQLSGEMLALATNQLQPVQAQQYTPQLETPYSVSFQDQMNANQADFNAMQRQYGYNPAAASQLAAQKYAANSAILGQQARANQEMQMGAYNRNRGVLNDSTIKNLAILDQQYQRQEQAKSNTKMQAQVALNSIADKIAKHKLENKTLGVMENMYNYRFGPKGRAYNVNAPYEFDTQLATMSADEIQEIADKRRESEKKSGTKEKITRNGSIVKAIKNL